MDSIKLEKLITENMKSIFGFALTRLTDVNEAEVLASDIVYELIRSVHRLENEERFYGFMWKIAENTYKTYLRNRSKKYGNAVEFDCNIADGTDIVDDIISKEEIDLLRRELSLLSKQYRDTTVLYYIEDRSCLDISNELNVTTEMVKYYLFRARKMIREGINMERSYGEKSYKPSEFEIDFWGTKAGEDSEYRDFQSRKIKGNILLAAYYCPVTAQEISMELGVAMPYLEDEIKLLMDRQYLIYKNRKYLTNIPIFTVECTKAINEKLKDLVISTAKQFISITDEFPVRFGDKFDNENLMRWQKVLMCMCFSLSKEDSDITGELPADGPYSLVNGGGGRGFVWGRDEITVGVQKKGIRGIYDGISSEDGAGIVYAMNFSQILNSQHFSSNLTAPVVTTAFGDFDSLSDKWKKQLETLGYVNNGRPNFTVWSAQEYVELKDILKGSVDLVTYLNRKTSEIAADITADLAPSHIRKTAEYIGAHVYRFDSIVNLVNLLYDMGWLMPVDDKDKPAICVVDDR